MWGSSFYGKEIITLNLKASAGCTVGSLDWPESLGIKAGRVQVI